MNWCLTTKTFQLLPKHYCCWRSLGFPKKIFLYSETKWFIFLTNALSFYGSKNVLGRSKCFCQTKNLFTYCDSHRHFVPDKKMIKSTTPLDYFWPSLLSSLFSQVANVRIFFIVYANKVEKPIWVPQHQRTVDSLLNPSSVQRIEVGKIVGRQRYKIENHLYEEAQAH